jgi:superfamily II DNA or RNA helicase
VSATFNLRPYQREAISAIRDAYQQRGINRPLIVLPTGAGKTVVFSHLARLRAAAGRVLIIAHREELLTQAAEKIMHIAPDLTIGIVKAERDDHQYADVILASIQTIARPRRVAPLIGTIGTIIVDEAHHAAAKTYRDALTALRAFEPDGPLTVGVTATAGRGDGVGLGSVWQEIVYQRGIIHMIAEGYLVDVRGLEVVTDLNYQNVKSSHGDFTDSSLGLEMENSGAIDAAAAAYEKYAKDRRGVAFTPTIANAEELAKNLTARGIRAEHVSGKTETHERRNILRRLKTGETQVVANCAVLTEGFDETSLSCVLIARPTKSRPLFVQMAGRGLRLHPGKEDALILNLFAPPDAGLATIADLAGLDPEKAPKVKDGESLVEAVLREEAQREVFGSRRVASVLTAKQLNLFARSGLRWIPASTGFVLPCGQTSLLLVPTGEDRWKVVQDSRGQTKLISQDLTLDWAQGVGEEYARANGGAIARADAGWRGKAVTPQQQQILTKLRIRVPATRGEASDAISAAYAGKAMAKLAKTNG